MRTNSSKRASHIPMGRGNFNLACAFVAVVLSGATLLRAEDRYEAKVNVTIEKTRNNMSLRALAADAALSDANLMDSEVPELLHAVGVTTLRYPGRSANRYHWSTYQSTRIQGSNPAKFDYYAPNNDFGKFVTLLGKFGGTAILTVNYGSNLDGSGGGEPAEAAAWVAYCNGNSSDAKDIGKDSTGYDWKTVGYWATLRASAPLASDDGRNFLRISHPEPLHIRYWEIGNEVFANGFYMKDGQNNSEEDLHAAYGNDTKENEKMRRGNARLSPAAYGNAVVEYAKAMKAVDPSIKVGAVLLAPAVKDAITKAGAQFVHWNGDGSPGNQGRSIGSGAWIEGVGSGLGDTSQIDWNPSVMKACGGVIDFAIIHWQVGKYLPPDFKKADPAAVLSAPYADLPQVVSGLLELFTKYGGPNAANIQLAVTGIAAGGLENDPLARALFLADTYVSLVEDGALAVVGAELHDASFLDAENGLGPTAYALGMIHILAAPNDPILASDSSNPLLAVHSAKRADGSIRIMLINKDPLKKASVKLALKGGTFAGKGARFDFGKSTGGGPSKSALDVGGNFSQDVPPYTISVVVVPRPQ